MRKLNPNLLYGLGIIIVVLVFSWYQHQSRGVNKIIAPMATSTQHTVVNEDAIALSKISPNCAKYYNNLGVGNDPINNELSDFINLHPLSDFLCSEYSMIQPKIKLADGKFLHFVSPVFLLNCGGSGHCTYYPLLEEKPGLVRHIRGFTWYDDAGSTSTISVSQDTEGTIFAWEISYDPLSNTLVVDDSQLDCGTKNVYKFNSKDEPILVSAVDSCLSGNGVLYPVK